MAEPFDTDELRKGVIAAHRYLAFLETERLALLHELYPGIKRGDPYNVPFDHPVMELFATAGPLDRASTMLRAASIADPYEHDAWVKTTGVKISDIPPLRPDDIRRA